MKTYLNSNKLYYLRIFLYFFIFSLFTMFLYLLFSTLETDEIQGDSFYTIFYHVPFAWLSLLSFYICSVFSIYISYSKIISLLPYLEVILYTSIVSSGITLFTGSMWGYQTWGIFWSWDPRITTMLLLFIYLIIALILLKVNLYKKSFHFLIIGGCIYPFIKYTTQLWHSIHQTDSLSFTNVSIANSIFMGLINMLLVLVLLMVLNSSLYVTIKKYCRILTNFYTFLKK